MASERASRGGEPEIAIEVSGLTKSFGGKMVVRDLSMRVKRGQIYGFLGPNGSGKTTTMRMLCGLLTPDEGGGTALGFDIRRDTVQLKRRVGYMTQRFSLYEDLSIRENLEFVARVYGVPEPSRAATQAIEDLGLADRATQLAGELSGGWKQRLALSACILPQPQLLLLDEPTAGVDPKARREFWSEIHRLVSGGITALVSTHYMDEAERCHEIAYINRGRLLAQGTIAEVIAGARLSTYTVTGPDLEAVSNELAAATGASMVAAFGASLHVAGRATEAFEAEIAGFRARHPELNFAPSAPTLEDVFISLIADSRKEAA